MEKKILLLEAHDNKNRQIPQSFINYWNNVNPVEVENKILKEQVNTLIANLANLETLIKMVTPSFNFFKDFQKPVASKQRISKKEKTKIELDEHVRMLEMAALNRIKKRTAKTP